MRSWSSNKAPGESVLQVPEIIKVLFLGEKQVRTKGCSLVAANYSSIQCITGPQRTYAGSELSREKMSPGIGDGAVLTFNDHFSA